MNLVNFLSLNNEAAQCSHKPHCSDVRKPRGCGQAQTRPAHRRPLQMETLENRELLSIAPAVPYPLDDSPHALVANDFNGDGRLDLAVAVGNSTGDIDVLLGNADGTFQAPIRSLADSTYPVRSMAAGDLDGDGTTDLVVTSLGGAYQETGNLTLLFGNGDGTFQPPVGTAFYGPLSLAMGDIDEDGDLDLALTVKALDHIEPTFKVRFYDYYVVVFRNDLDTVNHFANMNFAYAQFLHLGTGGKLAEGITIADINGHPSVAFTTIDSNNTWVMQGNGSINLGGPQSFHAGTARRSVAVGDVNGDGRADLVTANNSSNDVSVMLGTGGSPAFQTAVSYPVGTNPLSVILADMNADGVLDAITANSGGSDLSLLVGNGDGTFQPAQALGVSATPIALVAGNFNGDNAPGGRPYTDLAVVHGGSSIASVLLNGADRTANSSVIGRHVFYNQSKFDGNDAAANSNDDPAVAPDKSAYLPGSGAATWDNMTSYSRGLNGIMIDLAGDHGPITAADFILKVGANNTPSQWAAASPPSAVVVRPGAGVSGSDRIELVWTAGNAPKNSWLEVTLRGNDAAGGFNTNTGLSSSDVFFFGNKIGESSNGSAALAQTTILDVNSTRTNTGTGSTITNPFDFDRSGTVTVTDVNVARTNTGNLTKINISSPPAAPQQPDGSETAADDQVAFALILTAPAGAAQVPVAGASAVTRLTPKDTTERTGDVHSPWASPLAQVVSIVTPAPRWIAPALEISAEVSESKKPGGQFFGAVTPIALKALNAQSARDLWIAHEISLTIDPAFQSVNH